MNIHIHSYDKPRLIFIIYITFRLVYIYLLYYPDNLMITLITYRGQWSVWRRFEGIGSNPDSPDSPDNPDDPDDPDKLS